MNKGPYLTILNKDRQIVKKTLDFIRFFTCYFINLISVQMVIHLINKHVSLTYTRCSVHNVRRLHTQQLGHNSPLSNATMNQTADVKVHGESQHVIIGSQLASNQSGALDDNVPCGLISSPAVPFYLSKDISHI